MENRATEKRREEKRRGGGGKRKEKSAQLCILQDPGRKGRGVPHGVAGAVCMPIHVLCMVGGWCYGVEGAVCGVLTILCVLAVGGEGG